MLRNRSIWGAALVALVLLWVALDLKGRHFNAAAQADPQPGDVAGEPTLLEAPVVPRRVPADDKREVSRENVADIPQTLVVGRCVDVDGSGVPGVDIFVESPPVQVLSLSDGRFVVPIPMEADVSRMIYLSIRSRSHGWMSFPVRVPAESTTDLGDILLTPACSITGHVRDEAQRLVEGATVAVAQPSELDRDGWFEGPRTPLVTVTSNALGQYELNNVASGQLSVWAHGTGTRWAHTDISSLEPGESLVDVDLVLETLETDDCIDLAIVDSMGQSVPQAEIRFSVQVDGFRRRGTLFADWQGRRRVPMNPKGPYSFVANDQAWNSGSAIALDTPPGAKVVMQLPPPSFFHVQVARLDGGQVPSLQLVLEDAEGLFGRLGGSSLDSDGDNTFKLIKPPVPFLILVEAGQLGSSKHGPFDPTSLPSSFTITIDGGSACQGRVVSYGTPVPGAIISLHRAFLPESPSIVNGLPARSEKAKTSQARTDPEGRFVLSIPVREKYFVRAEAAGLAANDIGPLDLDPNSPVDLEVELYRGGIIRAEILVPPGERSSGRTIAASRGDGFTVSKRADAKGVVLFESLTPGRWLVRAIQESVGAQDVSMRASASSETEWPWSCEVFDDKVAPYLVDLRHPREIVGSLMIAGQPASNWKVLLIAEDQSLIDGQSSDLDSSGRFQIRTYEQGRYRLTVQGNVEDQFVFVQDLLDLTSSRVVWDCELPTGSIEGSADLGVLRKGSSVRYLWRGGGQRLCVVQANPNANGQYSLSCAPEGSGTLFYQGQDGVDVAVPVEVRYGETARVDLP